MFPSNLAHVLACQLASRTASRAVAGAPRNSRPFPRPAQLGALRWCARVGSLLVSRDGAWAWSRTHHRAHVHSCTCDAVQSHRYGTTRSSSRAGWRRTALLPTHAGLRADPLAASPVNALYGSLGGSHAGRARRLAGRCTLSLTRRQVWQHTTRLAEHRTSRSSGLHAARHASQHAPPHSCRRASPNASRSVRVSYVCPRAYQG